MGIWLTQPVADPGTVNQAGAVRSGSIFTQPPDLHVLTIRSPAPVL
jgi:hypothetical protein